MDRTSEGITHERVGVSHQPQIHPQARRPIGSPQTHRAPADAPSSIH